jgi:hypothetical protein
MSVISRLMQVQQGKVIVLKVFTLKVVDRISVSFNSPNYSRVLTVISFKPEQRQHHGSKTPASTVKTDSENRFRSQIG